MIQEFLFEATDASGKAEHNAVVAVDVADARLQLERMGYSAIEILNNGFVRSQLPEQMVPDFRQKMAKARYVPVWRQVLDAYWRCRTWWLPGLAATILCLVLGYALYLPLFLLLVGLGVSSTIAVPIMLYELVLRADVEGQWSAGLRYLALFRKMNGLRGTREMELDWYQAKLMAGDGELDEALSLFSVHAHASKVTYLSYLASIYRNGGDQDTMIEMQRQAMFASGGTVNTRIDLAWSLVRYTTRYQEARDLIASIDERELTELARQVVLTVQAQLAQADGHHDQALVMMRNVDDERGPYKNAASKASRRELHGYMALSLKVLGQTDEAEVLWQDAIDTLRHLNQHLLIERYESIGKVGTRARA